LTNHVLRKETRKPFAEIGDERGLGKGRELNCSATGGKKSLKERPGKCLETTRSVGKREGGVMQREYHPGNSPGNEWGLRRSRSSSRRGGPNNYQKKKQPQTDGAVKRRLDCCRCCAAPATA